MIFYILVRFSSNFDRYYDNYDVQVSDENSKHLKIIMNNIFVKLRFSLVFDHFREQLYACYYAHVPGNVYVIPVLTCTR